MLCSFLPFDDDYVPNLFQKITEGQYYLPPDISPAPVALLKTMMVLDPNERATIKDIRQWPWFLDNLPPYLKEVTQPRGPPLIQNSSDLELRAQRSERTDYDTNALEWIAQNALAPMNTSFIKDHLNSNSRHPLKVAYRIQKDRQEAQIRAWTSVSFCHLLTPSLDRSVRVGHMNPPRQILCTSRSPGQ